MTRHVCPACGMGYDIPDGDADRWLCDCGASWALGGDLDD